jgi:hypothetical protein
VQAGGCQFGWLGVGEETLVSQGNVDIFVQLV